MANFRWTDTLTRPIEARYFGLPQGDVYGLAEWERLMNGLSRFQTPGQALPFLESIRSLQLTTPRRPCPRLFVSHRQADEPLARRIAWCANQERVEYWLDVIHLPQSLPQYAKLLSTLQQAVLTAAIIEIALINCTHVIAVMTDKTTGSRWVPYEYGRIKDDLPAHQTASCWRHPILTSLDLPEYLHLAPIFNDEPAIRDWLRTERHYFTGCTGDAAGLWPDDEAPEPLPSGPDARPVVIISRDP